jgi:hypothetical protein
VSHSRLRQPSAVSLHAQNPFVSMSPPISGPPPTKWPRLSPHSLGDTQNENNDPSSHSNANLTRRPAGLASPVALSPCQCIRARVVSLDSGTLCPKVKGAMAAPLSTSTTATRRDLPTEFTKRQRPGATHTSGRVVTCAVLPTRASRLAKPSRRRIASPVWQVWKAPPGPVPLLGTLAFPLVKDLPLT